MQAVRLNDCQYQPGSQGRASFAITKCGDREPTTDYDPIQLTPPRSNMNEPPPNYVQAPIENYNSSHIKACSLG